MSALTLSGHRRYDRALDYLTVVFLARLFCRSSPRSNFRCSSTKILRRRGAATISRKISELEALLKRRPWLGQLMQRRPTKVSDLHISLPHDGQTWCWGEVHTGSSVVEVNVSRQSQPLPEVGPYE
jgi:hypothetical protein